MQGTVSAPSVLLKFFFVLVGFGRLHSSDRCCYALWLLIDLMQNVVQLEDLSS